MLEYAAERYPHIERHVSVQASATNEEAINFYHRNFDVARVVLPRVLSIHQVKQLARVTPVPWKCSPSVACALWLKAVAIFRPI